MDLIDGRLVRANGAVGKLRAIKIQLLPIHNYCLFTALLQPSVERYSTSASNLPGGTPVN